MRFIYIAPDAQWVNLEHVKSVRLIHAQGKLTAAHILYNGGGGDTFEGEAAAIFQKQFMAARQQQADAMQLRTAAYKNAARMGAEA